MTNLNDLQQVREFVQIAASGSISRAAKALGMSQPTLSRHLAALEAQIGAPLIRRDTHTMSLTDAGIIVLADARELLTLADRMGSRLRAERHVLRGHLRMVSVVDVGQWVVSRVLSRFQRLHPGVSTELHLLNRATKFIKEGFDCGIMVGATTDRQVTIRKIAQLQRRIVAAPRLMKDHTLPTRPEDLKNLPWLGILQPHFYSRDKVDLEKAKQIKKLKLSPVMLLDTVTALREATIEGAGFTILPEWMAARDIAAGRLVQLLPDWHLAPLDLQIAHAAHEHLPQRVKSLIEYLQQELPAEIHRLDLNER